MAKRRSAGRIFVYFIMICVLLLLLSAGGAYLYLRHMLDGMERTSITKDDTELGISEETTSSNQVVNIALFGVDTRDSTDTGRSDAMIILSVDQVHKKVKMTSLARDTRVEIEGYGYEKLCHAYAYGGPELAIQTINRNFGLDIRDYVTVNFEQLAGIIDLLGGVVINVDQDEADVFNSMFASDTVPAITETGDIRLTGAQAVGYARNRTTGSDVARQSRQREVLMAIYDEVRAKSVLEYPGILEQVLRLCETSLESDKIMELGMWVVFNGPEIVEFALPNSECDPYGGIMEDGLWYFVYDLDIASDVLHQFIYDDIQPAE